MQNFYEQLLEHDLNPFLLFDANGKVKSYNKEAEFLLNFVNVRELFELAVSNASVSFGFNHHYLHLKYNKQTYYGILVGYVSDDELALRLYKEVSGHTNVINNEKLKLVNIYSLIDLSKNSTLLNTNLKIQELYDISIPEMKLSINEFLLCINDIFTLFKDEENISLVVQIKTGEYEIINNKKCKIVSLEFHSQNPIGLDKNEEITLEMKSKKANTNIFFEQNALKLELPMIL